MFFFFSKVLAFLTYPVVWIFILLVVALLTKSAKRRKRFLVATLISYFVLTNSFLLDEFMRWWEVPAISYEEIHQPYNGGIVLGGTISYDPGIKRYQFLRQGDRIQQAILLYKAGKIKKIIFSGGAGDLNPGWQGEGPIVKQFLLDLGVPETDILIEGQSRNTFQNATYTKTLLDETIPNGNFLLITSAAHQSRAVKCFTKAGIRVSPFSVDRWSGPRKFEFGHLFIPEARQLYGWQVLIHEWIGYVAYKVMGYI